MEIESSSAPITSKKLWKKVKVVVYMLRKTLAKTKLLVDLHIKLKNGKLARKALTNLLLHHHYAAFTCRCSSNNIDTLFISPQKHILPSSKGSNECNDQKNKIEQVAIFDVLSNGTIEPSTPMASDEVVDSPLQAERECEVDKEAEAFIEKFYKQLKQQHITYVESPSPNHSWTL